MIREIKNVQAQGLFKHSTLPAGLHKMIKNKKKNVQVQGLFKHSTLPAGHDSVTHGLYVFMHIYISMYTYCVYVCIYI